MGKKYVRTHCRFHSVANPYWIFIGYIANRIMSGEGKGCCMNLFIGIVGSYAGAIISNLLNIELFGKGYLTNFVFCVIGAIAVLWIWKKLFD